MEQLHVQGGSMDAAEEEMEQASLLPFEHLIRSKT